MIWQVISGEYPPRRGGVSDYTRTVAQGLAATGDRVEVWAPDLPRNWQRDGKVELHRLADRFGPRALVQLNRALGRTPDSRVLLQYVPQALGLKGINLPFCWWLAHRSIRPIVMFHEVTFPISWSAPLKHNLLGLVTCTMAALIARAAASVLVATPIWSDVLREQCNFSGAATWAPLPSTIVPLHDEAAVLALRQRHRAPDSILLGHFGGYPQMLHARLDRLFSETLAQHPHTALLLLGANSRDFHAGFLRTHPSLSSRVFAPGLLSSEHLSHHLSSCDLMLQLYPDGACTRRTTLIAALAHGRPVVTTEGCATEAIWRQGRALALTADADHALQTEIDALLERPERRRAYGDAGAALYRERFGLEHTMRLLREAGCASQ